MARSRHRTPWRCRHLGHRLHVHLDHDGRAYSRCRRRRCDHADGPWSPPFAAAKARGGSLRGLRREG